MHTTYLGYSVSLSGTEMIRYFDIDPEEGVSKFERSFGCGYIEPGSFEVYDRTEYKSFGFDTELFSRLVPFNPDLELVSQIDFSSAKSVFYVKVPRVVKLHNDEVNLLGPMAIEQFDFE